MNLVSFRLLSKHPEKFEVHLWEKCEKFGGVATSHIIDDQGLYINDGVQGGAPSYRNTLLLHKVIYIEIFTIKNNMLHLISRKMDLNPLKYL